MKEIAISVLIPICNVEKYLYKCMESITKQTLKNIEIICINDGSSDNSLEIIKKFAEFDERIVIIDKTNSGYGDSMNKGLEIAKGQYIGIVESDDFINEDMFENLYNLAIKNKADIVKSSFYFYWENPEKIIYHNSFNIKDISYNLKINKIKMLNGAASIWSAIYKRSFIENSAIKFLTTPGAAYQDTSFNFKVTCLAKSIVLSPVAYLYYRQDNLNSSVKTANMEKALCLHKEFDEIRQFIINNKLEVLFSIYCTNRFNAYMWNYSRLDKKYRSEYFKIILNELQKEKIWSIDFKKLNKIAKFGGYFSVILKNRILLDLLLKINCFIKYLCLS